MEIRARDDRDLDACVALVRRIHGFDGYPPRMPHDLRSFVTSPGALGAWVAVGDPEDRPSAGGDVLGQVVLRSESAPGVLKLAADRAGAGLDDLAVVARLVVDPGHRRAGLGAALLATAAAAAHAAGRRPVLDVAAHLEGAVALYRRSGWDEAGCVTVEVGEGPPLDLLVFVGPAPPRGTDR